MSETGWAATRYEAAKLYLIGKYAAQLLAAARTGEAGCASVLHHMAQLAAGVLPWEVVQGLNSAYADLAESAESAESTRSTESTESAEDGAAVLADAARVIACIEWLEARIIPDWDVRAKT